MFNHAPPGYVCPFCLLLHGVQNPHVLSRPTDIVLQNEWTTAFISSHQWPNNAGHVLVVPNAHYENLYDLPIAFGAEIYAAAKAIAHAMKQAYGCHGVSTRQHNEPGGNQDVWHYHLHVFPRYENDNLYESKPVFVEPERRAQYAQQLQLAVLRKPGV